MATEAVKFSPFWTQNQPGGSVILDRNLAAIKKALEDANATFVTVKNDIDTIVTTINFNFSSGTTAARPTMPPGFGADEPDDTSMPPGGMASDAAMARARFWLSTSDPALPNGVNMGALASGVLQQTVAAGVSTPSVFAAGADRVPYGSGSNGQLTDNANFTHKVVASVNQLAIGQAAVTNASLNVDVTGPTYGAIRASISGGGNINLYVDNVTGSRVESHTDPDGKSTLNAAATRVVWGATGYDVQVSAATAVGVTRTYNRYLVVHTGSAAPIGTVIYGEILTGTPTDLSAGGGVTTTATKGFLYIASCAGPPTGVPSLPAALGTVVLVPMVYDRTNDRVSYYTTGWYYTPLGGDRTIASASGVTWDPFKHGADTLTLTGTTTVDSIRYVRLQAPTITDSSAVTVTKAATLSISRGPAASGSVTITTALALDIEAGAYAHHNLTGANYERLRAVWTSSVYTLQTEAGGIGSIRPIRIVSTAQTTSGGYNGVTIDEMLNVNGAASLANSALTVGHTTNTARDHIQFFVGGGATPDSTNTFFDINVANTSFTGTVGVWATQRIRSYTITGSSAPVMTEAAALYIDGAPSVSGFTTEQYSVHIAAGLTRLDADQAWYNAGPPNYERVRVFWNSNVFTLKSEKGGSGTLRAMKLDADTSTLTLNASAGLVATSTSLTITSETGGTGHNLTIVGNGSDGQFSLSAWSTFTLLATSNASVLGDTLRLTLTGSPTQASGASIVCDAVKLSSGATVTGSTNITTATGFNLVVVPRGSIAKGDAGAVTVTSSASFYIENAPLAGSSITITNPYALWVDAGVSRFDGNGTHVFELPADATGNVSAAVGRVPINIGGATKYLRYYND